MKIHVLIFKTSCVLGKIKTIGFDLLLNFLHANKNKNFKK